MRKNIYDTVAAMKPLDSLEQAHQEDVLRWIASGVELCRVEKPANPPKHLVSYCVLLDVEKKKLLLTAHTKSQLWLPTGGHVEQGEHPADTACRELREELNVSLPLLHPEPLFLTVTETAGTISKHTDVSLWYAFQADCSVKYTYSTDEFTETRWFPISDLPLKRSDPHIGRFCEKIASKPYG